MCMALAACQPRASTATTPASSIETMTFAPSLGIDLTKFTRMPSGTYWANVTEGTGSIASVDRYVTVRYVAFLPDGTVVDSRDEPTGFLLGPDVIKGWRDGLTGMR